MEFINSPADDPDSGDTGAEYSGEADHPSLEDTGEVDGVLADNNGEDDIEDDSDPSDEETGANEGFLSFRQPFDGTQPEVPADEQQAAGAQFASFAEDLLSSHADETDNGEDEFYRHDLVDGDRVLGLVLTQLPPENQVLRNCSYRLEIIEELPTGADGESTSYQLGLDGVLRRDDETPETEEEVELARRSDADQDERWQQIVDDVASPEVVEEYRRRRQELDGQIDEDYRLRERLGLRNQPVGVRETQALISLVTRLLRG